MKTNFSPIVDPSFLVFNETYKDSKMEIQNTKISNSTFIKKVQLPEILFITSYPPRECGIATYSQDLKKAIQDKFGSSFSMKVCALEGIKSNFVYPQEVKYILNTQQESEYKSLQHKINFDKNVKMIFLQHEFGLFGGDYGDYLLKFISHIKIPLTTTFHTVLPNPNKKLKKVVCEIAHHSNFIIVMTHASASILIKDYGISSKKIIIIAHGTHLVASLDNNKKSKVHLSDRIVLSTFGLLNEGKSIETALEALPEIIKNFPNVIYLIIGKTHPEVFKIDGEKYRDSLYKKIYELKLQDNVRFINRYLDLNELIDYLQRTNVYLFTSKDPNQAVSGTLAYAMSSGCPVVSTPIPHAKELLENSELNFDFQNSKQLADATIKLLYNPKLLKEMQLNVLHKIIPTAWQNSALAHMELIKNSLNDNKLILKYQLPKISLNHIKRLTADYGIIQFAQIDTPVLSSGYTLDDNARALIAVCKHYLLTGDFDDLNLISKYLNFILFCQQDDGSFLNYVDIDGNFMLKNSNENLEDANGRAIWALGEFISNEKYFTTVMIEKAKFAIEKSLKTISQFSSPRAKAFSIKGLYFYNLSMNKTRIKNVIVILADDLVSKYRGVSNGDWNWFEDYLTYANSILPEAMLYAAKSASSKLYLKIAKSSFDFLLSITFQNNKIKVVSNNGWHLKGKKPHNFGEQPIDVAYTVLALNSFYEEFEDEDYREKMIIAFNWFLGNNHLHQIVYNPVTGGCYDGLEETFLNLNQGAESTVSYLMARLVFEKLNYLQIQPQLYNEIFQIA